MSNRLKAVIYLLCPVLMILPMVTGFALTGRSLSGILTGDFAAKNAFQLTLGAIALAIVIWQLSIPAIIALYTGDYSRLPKTNKRS